LLRRVQTALRRILAAAGRAAVAFSELVSMVCAIPLYALRPVALFSVRFVDGLQLRRDLLGVLAHAAIVFGGLAVGALIAFPVQDVTDRCPAHGEGYNFCALQKAWTPAVLIMLAAGCLAQFLARTALVRIPDWRRRMKAIGERRVGEEETREEPPYRSDPFLLAATWGEKHGPSERRRPNIFDKIPVLIARLRRR
jgi:hypothetical protein